VLCTPKPWAMIALVGIDWVVRVPVVLAWQGGGREDLWQQDRGYGGSGGYSGRGY
jgi:hypothetical protein